MSITFGNHVSYRHLSTLYTLEIGRHRMVGIRLIGVGFLNINPNSILVVFYFVQFFQETNPNSEIYQIGLVLSLLYLLITFLRQIL